MTRTQFSGSFLIVEGRDDRLFMVRFVALETCQIRVAYGKQNVCDTIDILDEDLFSGALVPSQLNYWRDRVGAV